MVLAVVRLQPSEEQTMKSCTLQTSGINFKPDLQILNDPRARLTPLEKFSCGVSAEAFRLSRRTLSDEARALHSKVQA